MDQKPRCRFQYVGRAKGKHWVVDHLAIDDETGLRQGHMFKTRTAALEFCRRKNGMIISARMIICGGNHET